ncbi:ABC transporter substrate-binding protein [Pseudoduganella namucuonensis]|uniref:Carbohydrate ABC transporter substrate-binding protein, CUT1 family n=1 Tax=Pseudoduganella namucuonensis TaxID=1035707 RepID=A0A1I7IZ30_9BURK|nr:ABC transporter substrate-binding protein [Pseudoduganella namucuonensis]SFU78132.1 carbohydrate ABC transporter substrate-binding protein, CUT1 family [Pseudoduganella namucuonensis]
MIPAKLRDALALGLALSCGQALAAEVTIACGSVGSDVEICRKMTDEWAARSGHTVRIFVTPNSSTDQLALYRQQFGAGSGEVDVLMVDVVWPGIVKQHLVDLAPHAREARKEHFPSIIANNTVDGKLLALPWFTDAGVLYYRGDLLKKYNARVPATWNELTATARLIQDGERAAGNRDMHGFVFQGKAYEGLTCNALEWVASFGGGTIVEPDGRISINNAQAAKALDLAASWPGNIAPKNVVSFAEEEARGVFQNGNAVFMRNWSYAWVLAQRADSKVKGRIGMTVLPAGDDAGKGGRGAATLGGWNLAVSRYSKNQAAAIDLVLYLTGKDAQKKRALLVGSLPTHPALYKDADILKSAPYYGQLLDVFNAALVRPSTVTGDKYNAVSSAFWNAAQSALGARGNGTDAVRKLEKDITRVRRGAAW